MLELDVLPPNYAYSLHVCHFQSGDYRWVDRCEGNFAKNTRGRDNGLSIFVHPLSRLISHRLAHTQRRYTKDHRGIIPR